MEPDYDIRAGNMNNKQYLPSYFQSCTSNNNNNSASPSSTSSTYDHGSVNNLQSYGTSQMTSSTSQIFATAREFNISQDVSF